MLLRSGAADAGAMARPATNARAVIDARNLAMNTILQMMTRRIEGRMVSRSGERDVLLGMERTKKPRGARGFDDLAERRQVGERLDHLEGQLPVIGVGVDADDVAVAHLAGQDLPAQRRLDFPLDRALERPSSVAASRMRCEPMFEVMITIVFLKSTVRP